jgi:putative ABC transport system permease protein
MILTKQQRKACIMFRIVDIIAFTIERIRQHLLLVFWVLLGISIAVTLALSLPLYVDSVYSGILESRLSDPPYAYRFRYLGSWNGNLSINDSQSISAAVEGRYVELLGLPLEMGVRYTAAGRWNTRLSESNIALGTWVLGSLTGSEDLIRVTSGEWPAENDEEGRVPLLVPDTMLFANGVQLGDAVTIQRQGGDAVEAYVAAMWQPYNPTDPRWIFPPRAFAQVMLVPQETLFELVAEIEDPIDELGWYLILDGSDLRTSEIDELLAASEEGESDIQATLPETNLDASPNQGLKEFSAEVNNLTLQLFIIVLPVGGLVLYFVSLVAGLLVTRQQAEDVKLRSRGMSRGRVLAVHFLMWTLIVSASMAIAIAVSPYLVALIGRTASFLDFTGQSSVTGVVITREAFLIALAAGLIAASGGLLLAWRITLQNINSMKRVSRNSEKAWWQRTYLDLLAIGLAGYTLYTLVNKPADATESPFSDPITFIAPTLFALGLTLLFLRILPLLINILAGMMSVTSDIPLLMALRELVRGIGRYRGTLLMTAFTLSLVGFTASMASSIDQSLLDVVQYKTGAELVIVAIPDAQTETVQDSDTGETSQEVTGFNAPPTQELLALPEVESLSRMGRYDARMEAGNQRISGLALGVDRAGLGGSVFMRGDYSEVPLGNMLNLLADNRTGVILSEKTADEFGILIGQEITYQVQVLGEWGSEIRATVVGFVEYFPTLNPADYQFFLITNLDPIFEVSGTPLPFNVWVNIAEGVSVADAKAAIDSTDFPVLRYLDPETELLREQAEPSRRGVLGFLSVGFVASIVLTLIGAVIQSTASFQEQMAQLGSLRAMGMSGFAVRLYIMVLQGLIAVSGVASGTLIGLGTTILFLPYFDFGGGLPPYLVRVAWDEIAYVYGIFSAVLLLVAFLMSFVLSRQQLSRVVKLGNI